MPSPPHILKSDLDFLLVPLLAKRVLICAIALRIEKIIGTASSVQYCI